jgi:hypothetical protein
LQQLNPLFVLAKKYQNQHLQFFCELDLSFLFPLIFIF